MTPDHTPHVAGSWWSALAGWLVSLWQWFSGDASGMTLLIWAVCASGAWESLLRIGCIGWVEITGMVVPPNQNLCEAATELELYQWGLVQLAALALLIAGSAHNRGQHG